MLFFADLVVGTTKSDCEEHDVTGTAMATTGMELQQRQGPIHDGDVPRRGPSVLLRWQQQWVSGIWVFRLGFGS
ncbi:hypothetical protein TIFTF001_021894 [Ficus carica]|uniref:Uncharacterized protein n=1 Tax=Ficus carica TaxID=3494 RepID=A0AA88DF11_FICCA|nr:hypothetical protein TIFTF001_021894 [Ficus carica]